MLSVIFVGNLQIFVLAVLRYLITLTCHSYWFTIPSVVSGLGGLEVQGSRVQIRLRSMDFSQDVKILSTSPQGGTLSWGSRVCEFRLVKEPQA